MDKKELFSRYFSIVLLILMLVPVWVDYSMTELTDRQLKGGDIYYIWKDGKEISAGINPYASIHQSDMLHNKKYSTYLPGFFLLEVLLIKLGISDFEKFFPLWRFFVTAVFSFTGILLFSHIYRKSAEPGLALFAALFWLVGRWSFSALRIWQIDFLAILVLLLALIKYDSSRKLSFFLLGVSLSIKQIGIFVLPVFLIKLWLDQRKELPAALACLISMPLLTSLPFIIWDWQAFFKSLFFSVTRNPGGYKIETVDQIFEITGITAKIPLVTALFLVYILFFRAKISMAQAMLLAFLSFVTFNSVLFKQYFPWVSAFVGLALVDLKTGADSKTGDAK